MSRHNHPITLRKQRRIVLDPMPLDPRVAFVERVCSLLSDARWGCDRTSQLVIHFSDRPDLEPIAFYDLSETGLVPSYPLAEVVDAVSPRNFGSGPCLASRLVIRDVALALGCPEDGYYPGGGPSP